MVVYCNNEIENRQGLSNNKKKKANEIASALSMIPKRSKRQQIFCLQARRCNTSISSNSWRAFLLLRKEQQNAQVKKQKKKTEVVDNEATQVSVPFCFVNFSKIRKRCWVFGFKTIAGKKKRKSNEDGLSPFLVLRRLKLKLSQYPLCPENHRSHNDTC